MRRRAGFTLLEIMVVIVITGVVALIVYGTAAAGFDTMLNGEAIADVQL